MYKKKVKVVINSNGAWEGVSSGKEKNTAPYTLPIGWGEAVENNLASKVRRAQERREAIYPNHRPLNPNGTTRPTESTKPLAISGSKSQDRLLAEKVIAAQIKAAQMSQYQYETLWQKLPQNEEDPEKALFNALLDKLGQCEDSYPGENEKLNLLNNRDEQFEEFLNFRKNFGSSESDPNNTFLNLASFIHKNLGYQQIKVDNLRGMLVDLECERRRSPDCVALFNLS